MGKRRCRAARGDAALIADCAAFHAAFGRERAARGPDESAADRLADATDAAFARILGAEPATEAGLRAKAGAAMARLLWQAAPLTNVPWRGQASPAERAALECLARLAGRDLP